MRKLIVVIFCTVVLAGVTRAAGPSLNRLLDSVKLSTASVGFLSDLELAQGEAFNRNSAVVMCKSSDGETCTHTGAWDQGWIVFADANANGVHEHSEKVIVRSPRLASNLRFSGEVRAVTFSPAGAMKLVGLQSKSATLTVCRQSPELAEARRITLAVNGASHVERSTVGSCA